MAGGDAGIVEAAHLPGHLGEIDGHAVALHGDAPRLGRLADRDAVVVHEGFRLVVTSGIERVARAAERPRWRDGGSRARACGDERGSRAPLVDLP
jgi:hypothetical protein